MARVTELCHEAAGQPCFICDFSPPRSGRPVTELSASLNVDLVSVAYNPGRSVRTDSAMLASHIRNATGREVVFTLATRDMNLLALQSHLLGAQLLGLENVIVVQGDPFPDRDLRLVQPAGGYPATGLIRGIAGMNRGVDFRETRLDSPTTFCVGAAVDLGKGVEREACLAHRKVQAGAEFLITQPIFSVEQASEFENAYSRIAGCPLPAPVFYGLQVMERGGLSFSRVPREIQDKLDAGHPGPELAAELYRRFRASGRHNFYLVPPIRKGGSRGYAATREFLAAIGR